MMIRTLINMLFWNRCRRFGGLPVSARYTEITETTIKSLVDFILCRASGAIRRSGQSSQMPSRKRPGPLISRRCTILVIGDAD